MQIDPETINAVVETADGGSIRAGIWTGVIVALLGFLGVVASNWRGWKETASAGRTADFRRLREDIERLDTDNDELKAEVKALRADLSAALAKIADGQMRIVRLQTAFALVSNELARHDPGNEILKQARDLIGQAAMSDEDVFQAGLNTLSTGKGRP